MRDPKRIREFCNRFTAAWAQVHDWRFGQLMCNALGEMAANGTDPFFPEEDKMIEFIENYCANISQ